MAGIMSLSYSNVVTLLLVVVIALVLVAIAVARELVERENFYRNKCNSLGVAAVLTKLRNPNRGASESGTERTPHNVLCCDTGSKVNKNAAQFGIPAAVNATLAPVCHAVELTRSVAAALAGAGYFAWRYEAAVEFVSQSAANETPGTVQHVFTAVLGFLLSYQRPARQQWQIRRFFNWTGAVPKPPSVALGASSSGSTA